MGHDAVVLVDDGWRPRDGAAERRPLHRRRLRIVRIELHDPAELVRLARVLLHVEAAVVTQPGVLARGSEAVALQIARFRRLLRIAGEVPVDVLLCDQHGAPRRLAAGTIVERADDFGAGRIAVRPQPSVAGRARRSGTPWRAR